MQFELQTPELTAQDSLGQLTLSLFAEDAAGPAPADASVTLEVFPHRHQEVAACISRVRQYLTEGIEPGQLAIVVRDPSFEPLLQEEAALQHLPASLGVAPRQLLLTPLGRFVLTLYEIWTPDGLIMEARQFEAMLASGWLGAHVQATVDRFTRVKAQLFARCRSRAGWADAFSALESIRASARSAARMPAGSIGLDTIALWRKAIDDAERLCDALFEGADRPIGDHVRRLQDQILQLSPEELRQTEREVLERIWAAFDELADSTSLRMSATEFGDVLAGLVRERAQDAEADNVERPGVIWLTTPEGIDGYSKEIVLLLGADDRRMPRAYPEPWPFHDLQLDAHFEQERYLFLAVIRSASARLHLSYASADEGGASRPSPYLEDVVGFLGRRPVEPAELWLAQTPPPVLSPRPVRRARRQSYDLAEIAHFSLCPLRYKLEHLDRSARNYADPFQVRVLAQASWLHLLFQRAENSDQQARGTAEIRELLTRSMEQARPQLQRSFRGLSPFDWSTAEAFVRSAIAYHADHLGDDAAWDVAFEAASGGAFVVHDPVDDRTVTVSAPLRHAARRGRYSRPLLDDLQGEEWLLHGARPDDDAPADAEVQGIAVFADQYHAVQWWRQATSRAFYYATRAESAPTFAQRAVEEYAETVADIHRRLAFLEAGAYPKNPGDHCACCPVRGERLGLDP